MKVENMTNANGIKVANQFILTGEMLTLNTGAEENETSEVRIFQSYDFVIVRIDIGSMDEIYLDEYYWDYSRTTDKYRNRFLGETTKETQAKIDSGKYILTNLN